MKIYLYSFFDKVAGCWLPPVADSAPVDNVVETYNRNIKAIIKDEKAFNQLKDKSLYLIAILDDNSGVLSPLDIKTPLIDFDTLILNSMEVVKDENTIRHEV